ncbi:MAG: HyaD/HybD family hydrogenase maturation endopeptidase [Gemmatimonadota bacterium]|nr:HyaD/HybD family hydrogenase maturation endopeptidase [Gemmatimonadota bacterium]
MAGTVVIGLGNPLMCDDGVGLAALARLRDEWRLDGVELVDGATWGLSLVPVIEDSTRLLLVDAISAGLEPGELVELEKDRLPIYLSRKLSPHQVDMRDALAVAAWRGRLPEEVVAVGIQPESIELGTEITPRVAGTLDALVAAAVRRLEAWGHACVPAVDAHPSSGARHPSAVTPPWPPPTSVPHA